SVERNIELIGYSAGVPGVKGAAAALLVVGAVVVSGGMDSRAHEQADDLVSLLTQQIRGRGAIHSPAHGQDDARPIPIIRSCRLWRSVWRYAASGKIIAPLTGPFSV